MSEFHPTNDHDLLVRVDERLSILIQEFKDLKDNTKNDVADLKRAQTATTDRIASLENWRWYLAGAFSLALLALTLYDRFGS